MQSMAGVIASILLVALLAAVTIIRPWAQPSLAAVEARVASKYDGVTHIPLSEVSAEDMEGVVLLDVRERAEYEVSHLPGAIHVDPDADPATVLAQLGDAVKGRTVLAYCSVGERSSRMARALKQGAIDAGADDVANLQGGVFAWHNGGGELSRGGQATRDIHPFNDKWGRLVDDKAAITMTPPANEAR